MSRKEYNKQYHEEHKEEENARCKVYYETHREKVLAKQKEYRDNNKEKYNRKRRAHYYKVQQKVLQRHQILRLKVIDRLGNKCARCGFDDWRVLQVDHVKNDGYEERKKLRPKEVFERVLELSQEDLKANYQLLCANCNWIKRFEK